MRLKDISTLSPRYIGEPLTEKVSFVPMEGLRNGKVSCQEIPFNEGYKKYTYFKNEDLLVAKVTPCFENGNIAIAKGLLNGIGFGSSEFFVLRCNSKVINSYLFYQTQTSDFIGRACSTMCGVGGLKRITPIFMRTYELEVPSIESQKKIVSFLDSKLSKIDKIVSLLSQKRDAYLKLKKSIVNKAVTRGLNDDVKLKDSGIDWMGEIPETWSVIEIKHYCNRIFAGATPSTKRSDYWGGDIPWIPSGSCQNRDILTYDDTITQEGYDNSSTKLIPPRTTLMAMTGATCANVGYLMFPSCANQSVCAFVENKSKCFSRYLFYLLQAARTYILTFQTGGAQAGVNIQDCSLLKVPLNTYNEQKAIANYLDEKCAKIDAIVANVETQIEKYNQLRKSLIDEVITGKRKV